MNELYECEIKNKFLRKIHYENGVKTKEKNYVFKENSDFVNFGFGGHVTLWFTISLKLNILRRLAYHKIGNWISFKNMCISTI